MQLVNSTGTVTVSGASTFRDNASNQFEAQNGSGTATFAVSGAFFGLTNFPTTGAAEAPSPGTGTANSGLLISGSGTANMTATVTGSTFDENYANGYLSDTAGSATMNITMGTGAQRQRVHQQRRADRDRQCCERIADLRDQEQHDYQRHCDYRDLRDDRDHRGSQRHRIGDDGDDRRQHDRNSRGPPIRGASSRSATEFHCRTPRRRARTPITRLSRTTRSTMSTPGSRRTLAGSPGGSPDLVRDHGQHHSESLRHDARQRHRRQFGHAAGQRAPDLCRDLRQHAQRSLERV